MPPRPRKRKRKCDDDIPPLTLEGLLMSTGLLKDLCRIVAQYLASSLILTIGGFDSPHTLVDEWDREHNQWIAKPPLMHGRYAASYFLDEQDNIVVVGGRDRMNTIIRSIECWDRKLQSWKDVTGKYVNLSTTITNYSLLIRGGQHPNPYYFLFCWPWDKPPSGFQMYYPSEDKLLLAKPLPVNMCNRGHQCMVYDERRQRLWVLFYSLDESRMCQLHVGFHDEKNDIWVQEDSKKCPERMTQLSIYLCVHMWPDYSGLIICGAPVGIWRFEFDTLTWIEWAKDSAPDLTVRKSGYYGGSILLDHAELMVIDEQRDVHMYDLKTAKKQTHLTHTPSIHHRSFSTSLAI